MPVNFASESTSQKSGEEIVRSQAEILETAGPSRSINQGFPDEEELSLGMQERNRLGWGRRYQPQVPDYAARQQYKAFCQDLLDLTRQATLTADEESVDVFIALLPEIDSILNKLYDCRYGEEESLKQIVVFLRSQLYNAVIDRRHVELSEKTACFMRSQYLINEAAVNQVLEMIDECGLDPYRGILTVDGLKRELSTEGQG